MSAAVADERAATSNRPDHWAWLAAAFVGQGLSQLAAHLIAGRWLGSARYGEAATLVGALTLAGVPVVALQIAVAARVVDGGRGRPSLVRYGLAAVVLAAVVAILAPWWAGALVVDDVGAARWAALFLPATVALSVLRGVAVGRSRGRVLAGGTVAGAVTRLVAVIVGAQVAGVAGVVAAAVLAEAVSALVLFVALPEPPEPAGRAAVGGAERAVALRTSGVAAVSQTAVWVFTNVDLLWARRLLDEQAAGRYLLCAGAALGLVSLGQAVLWSRAGGLSSVADVRALVTTATGVVVVAAAVAVPVGAVVLPRLLGASFDGLGGVLAATAASAVVANVLLTAGSALLLQQRAGLWPVVGLVPAAVVIPWGLCELAGATPVHLALAAALNAGLGAALLVPRLRGAAAPAVTA